MNNNLTALVSCFARAYHSTNYKFKIFDDFLAIKLLSEEEYDEISQSMIKGIKYFNNNFKGTKDETLRYIVDNHLSSTVLGRSLYAEKQLKIESKLLVKQYLVFASGYDTSTYRYSGVKMFELDRKNILEDKKKRLEKANIDYSNICYINSDFKNSMWIKSLINKNYNKNEKTFCSLLGISYYLDKKEFEKLIKNMSSIMCDGSCIVFDYSTNSTSKESVLNERMAKLAKEEMKSKYCIEELEELFDKYNLLIYENMSSKDINTKLFYDYNTVNPLNKIFVPKDVNFCLVIKKIF